MREERAYHQFLQILISLLVAGLIPFAVSVIARRNFPNYKQRPILHLRRVPRGPVTMSICKAGFRILFVPAILALAGCAGLTKSRDQAVADSQPFVSSRTLAKSSKVNSFRANSPAKLKERDDDEPKEQVAKTGTKEPKTASPKKAEPQTIAQTSTTSKAEPKLETDATSETESLYVLDATLSMTAHKSTTSKEIEQPKASQATATVAAIDDKKSEENAPLSPPTIRPITLSDPDVSDTDEQAKETRSTPSLAKLAQDLEPPEVQTPPISWLGTGTATAAVEEKSDAPESDADSLIPDADSLIPVAPSSVALSSPQLTTEDRTPPMIAAPPAIALPPAMEDDVKSAQEPTQITSLSREKNPPKFGSAQEDPLAKAFGGLPGIQEPEEPADADVAAASIDDSPSRITVMKPSVSKLLPEAPTGEASNTSLALSSEIQEPSQPELLVESVTFCRQIHGYGSIDELSPKLLKPGSQVLVYAEVKNFVSKQVAGMHETVLQSKATLETAEGEVVFPIEFDPVIDQCESKRSDFFCHYMFRLPEFMAPGNYVLRLRVKDLHQGEIGEGQLAFKIHSLTK